MSKKPEYALLDSGEGRKLERFGPYVLDRPCSVAVWEKQRPSSLWNKSCARFSREGALCWKKYRDMADDWMIQMEGISLKLSSTEFGHLGVFPEHAKVWKWVRHLLIKARERGKKDIRILNLFAYSGGATLAAALEGACVCHVDASKGMVSWAKENAQLNGLQGASIRWIVDDARKFLARELRRGSQYDGILLDPPTFGRGKRGEVFKIEEDLKELLTSCRKLLSPDPLFVVLSCHTPGYTPLVMNHLMKQMMKGRKGSIESGELQISSDEGAFPVPSGTFSRWYDDAESR